MRTIITRESQKVKRIQKTTKFSIYIPPAMLRELKRVAKAEKRSVNKQILYYLNQHVTRRDDSIPDFAKKSDIPKVLRIKK